MRRPVVAVVAVVFAAVMAFSLAGCGGGDEGGEEAAVQEEVVEGVVAPTDAESEADVLSPLPEQEFEPFPTDETVIPSAVLDRLETKQPMILFFYDSTQRASDDQREEIDSVISDYRGLIDLVAFDVGKYVKTSEDGKIEVLPGLSDDDTADKAAKLIGSDYLAVDYTPYIVFVDTQAHITFRMRGYNDAVAIEREVLRATQ